MKQNIKLLTNLHHHFWGYSSVSQSYSLQGAAEAEEEPVRLFNETAYIHQTRSAR